MENKNTFPFKTNIVRESEKTDESRYHKDFVYVPQENDRVTVCESKYKAAAAFLETPFGETTEFFTGEFPKDLNPPEAKDGEYLFLGRKDGNKRCFYLYSETI